MTNHNPGGKVQVGVAALAHGGERGGSFLLTGPWAVLSHYFIVSAYPGTITLITAWAMCEEISILRR